MEEEEPKSSSLRWRVAIEYPKGLKKIRNRDELEPTRRDNPENQRKRKATRSPSLDVVQPTVIFKPLSRTRSSRATRRAKVTKTRIGPLSFIFLSFIRAPNTICHPYEYQWNIRTFGLTCLVICRKRCLNAISRQRGFAR